MDAYSNASTRSANSLISNAQSNYGQGWKSKGKGRDGVGGIIDRRRQRNIQNTQNMWRQQAIDEQNFKNALSSFLSGSYSAENRANQAFGNSGAVLDQFGNYLMDQRQAGIQRYGEGFAKARDVLADRAGREAGLANWLQASMSPLAHEQYATDVTRDEGFDRRAAKDARSVLNARGSGGVMAQAAIEEARFQSAAQREEMERAALAQAQGIGTNLWVDATGAQNRISDLHTAEVTAQNNLGLQYDTMYGQNRTQAAQNALNQGLFGADLEMARGNAQMGFWNQLQQTGRGDANWGREARYNIDNWAANAELQDYMLQQQIAAAKQDSSNALISGLLKGGTSLLTAGATGGGSILGSFLK